MADCSFIRDLAQERTTLKRLRLRDLGYRKGLEMDVGSSFTPLETLWSHYKANHLSLHMTTEPP